MNWFHRHTFDPAKWEEISRADVQTQLFLMGVARGSPLNIGQEIVYKNTCKECGELVFRRVNQIEN